MGALVIAMGATFVPSAMAANRQVTVIDDYFFPARVAVTPGETVTWTNPGTRDTHNVHFDDGQFIEPPTPSSSFEGRTRSFPAPGVYPFHCDVHGAPGGQGMSGVVYVNATGELPPVAQFTVSPNPGVAGRPVAFDAAASTATNTSIKKYEWDLNGDGMYEVTGTTPTTTRTYMTAQEELNVKLRVTDNRDATDVRTLPVRIYPAPEPQPQPAPQPQPMSQPQPPSQPAPSAEPPPTPQPITTPAGATPGPRAFSFVAAATASRAKGVKAKVTCTGRCRVTATLSVGASVARNARLGRQATNIGTAHGTLPASGTKTVTVKLTRKARVRLARLKSVSATLRLAVTDAHGATSRKQKSVKLRR